MLFIFSFLLMFFFNAIHKSFLLKKKKVGRIGELLGGPVVRSRRFHYHGSGSVPGWGTDILQVVWYAKKRQNKVLGEKKWKCRWQCHLNSPCVGRVHPLLLVSAKPGLCETKDSVNHESSQASTLPTCPHSAEWQRVFPLSAPPIAPTLRMIWMLLLIWPQSCALVNDLENHVIIYVICRIQGEPWTRHFHCRASIPWSCTF